MRDAVPMTGQPTLSMPDALARATALATSGGRRVLGLVGPPGAGKSTVSTALQRVLGAAMVVVGMDGFHLANAELIRLDRRQRKGAPDTFDVDGYVRLLTRLRAQSGPLYAPRFDRELEESIGSAVLVEAGTALVVTEGNYLLHDEFGWDEVRPQLDEVWYLHLNDAERRRRLVQRRLDHGDTVEHAAHWVEHVDEPNAVLVAATRHRADAVVVLD